MRHFLVLLVVLFAGWAHGATFHVSNAGSDEAAGATPETAWATLDKVNAAALAPGDTVLLQRGGVWRGQLRPQSGNDAAPVTYGAYGTGDKPKLLGSVERNAERDWVQDGNIWATREPVETGPNLVTAWELYVENGADARMMPEPVLQVDVAAQGRRGSDIQCYTKAFGVRAGRMYRLAFAARASSSVVLEMPVLMRAGAPWSRYGTCEAEGLPLTDDWKSHACYYVASQTADDARLTFFLGAVAPDGTGLAFREITFQECDADSFLPCDVGNIIFDGEKACGTKVWEASELDTQGEYWYDEERHVVKLYSTVNPATFYDDIECALRRHIIEQTNGHHIVYEGLGLFYGGAHGIGGANTHHITVRDCDLGYIGGGDQMGGERTVRFGNGIEFWASAHDNLVERCRLWEIYDAALTNQSSGPDTPQHDIIYRYNVIWNCEYSFEYWNRPEQSQTWNIRVEHNTCYNAGGGWGHGQRPDPSGRHLCFYDSPARARDIVITHNIFCEALGNAFYAPSWPREAIDALVMDYNCWYQSGGDMISLKEHRYAMGAFGEFQRAYAKEPHGLAAEPLFVDRDARDFRLTGGLEIGACGAMAAETRK